MGDSEANCPSIPSLNTDWPNVGSVFSKAGPLPLWRKITDAPQLSGGRVDDWHSIVRARASKETRTRREQRVRTLGLSSDL